MPNPSLSSNVRPRDPPTARRPHSKINRCMKDSEPNSDQGWPAVVGALIVIAILLTITLVAAGGWPWFQRFLDGSAAAWIQAVGSIAAILATAEIGRRQIEGQRQVERDRQAQEDRKKLLVIDALLEAVEATVVVAKKQYDEYPNMPVFVYHLDRMKNAADALAKIDFFNCPPSVIQPLLHLFPAPCDGLLAAIQKFNESFYKLDDRHEKHWSIVSNSFTVQQLFLTNARTACRTALTAQLP